MSATNANVRFVVRVVASSIIIIIIIPGTTRVCVKSFSMPNSYHNIYGDLKTVKFVEFYRPTPESSLCALFQTVPFHPKSFSCDRVNLLICVAESWVALEEFASLPNRISTRVGWSRVYEDDRLCKQFGLVIS